jgi:hypothetical protein
MNDIMPNGDTHEIPGWDRPAWAVRGVRDRDELTWTREASIDVTYLAGGVEETFAPELIRTDQVSIGEDGARVIVGQTVIQHADGCTITPDQARVLAAALVELAHWAEGVDQRRSIRRCCRVPCLPAARTMVYPEASRWATKSTMSCGGDARDVATSMWSPRARPRWTPTLPAATAEPCRT